MASLPSVQDHSPDCPHVIRSTPPASVRVRPYPPICWGRSCECVSTQQLVEAACYSLWCALETPEFELRRDRLRDRFLLFGSKMRSLYGFVALSAALR